MITQKTHKYQSSPNQAKGTEPIAILNRKNSSKGGEIQIQEQGSIGLLIFDDTWPVFYDKGFVL